MFSRRDFLLGSSGIAAAPCVGASHVKATPTRSRFAASPGVAPLINRQRVAEVLGSAHLDALVVASPINVYYATSYFPIMSRFSQLNFTAALIPADVKRPIAFLGSAFEYYAGGVNSGPAEGVEPYLVGGNYKEADSAASPAFDYVGDYRLDARETLSRKRLEGAAPFYHGMFNALAKALGDRSLTKGAIGVDTTDATRFMQGAAPAASLRMADDLVLHIRLIKTPVEIALMRRASIANAQAALIAARSARTEGSLSRIRQRYYEEVARHGNTPLFGMVDLAISETTDGELRPGQGVMIDFVSHYGFYQSDYGRTIFYGEPDPTLKRVAATGAIAWQSIRERLKPGLKFSEIRSIGTETVKKLGMPFSYPFAPHSVGLQHWDHPNIAIDGSPIDLALQEGMVLSVDIPSLNAGLNGSTHLEDLMLITSTGAEPLNPLGNETISV